MDRKIKTLEDTGTWTTIPKPASKNDVGSKWVFCIKRKVDGTIEKYKAHLVACGFMQKYGIDYFNTFSPVVRLASFRLILTIATRNNWNIDVFDFNGTYLNRILDNNKEIYMQPPPGYDTQGESVQRLHKSLYGLKQAGHKWYDTLRGTLIDLGFNTCEADPRVFSLHKRGDIIILTIHIDDCIITGSCRDLISEYKQKLHSHYPLTDLGPVHWLPRIKITHDCDTHSISLSQTAYIKKILACFNLSDAKPLRSPITLGTNLSKEGVPTDPTEAARMKKTPYHEAIGSLMYAAITTRPNISYTISTLSQFLENPGKAHWQAVKQVFRYLSSMKTHALTYGIKHHNLVGFTDTDGTSQEHRHMISGFAFLLDGAAVSWGSRKQELITLSTAKAEYVATTDTAKECIWLR